MTDRSCILVVETSTRRGSIALVEGSPERVHGRDLDPLSSHDRDLLPAVARALLELGLLPRSIVGLVFGRGPGSFTGLRVGAATVLGLHHALAVPVLGRPSTEATAWRVLESEPACAIVLDARREAFFVARYARDERTGLRAVLAPQLCAQGELCAMVPPGEVVFTDAEVAIAGLLPAERNARASADIEGPRAASLWLAARSMWPPEPSAPVESHLLPLYLRASSPEEKRERESQGTAARAETPSS